MIHTVYEVNIYSDFVVEFDITSNENVEVRRYKKSSGRPKNPSEYLTVDVLRTIGLELSRSAIGSIVVDQAKSYYQIPGKIKRRSYEN